MVKKCRFSFKRWVKLSTKIIQVCNISWTLNLHVRKLWYHWCHQKSKQIGCFEMGTKENIVAHKVKLKDNMSHFAHLSDNVLPKVLKSYCCKQWQQRQMPDKPWLEKLLAKAKDNLIFLNVNTLYVYMNKMNIRKKLLQKCKNVTTFFLCSFCDKPLTNWFAVKISFSLTNL